MPPEFAAIMIAFQSLFSKRVFAHALVAGAILTPGRRTVTNALRIVGHGQETTFQNYHRVLNHARWSPAQASRILLVLLLRLLLHRLAPRRSSTKAASRGDHRA